MQTSSYKLGGIQILLIAAALITGVIHLGLGSDFLANIGDIMFLLNGIGFIGLAALYLLPLAFLKPYHEIVRWVFAGYSALTVILWVVMNGHLEPAGIAAKLAEIAIIAVMLIDRPKR